MAKMALSIWSAIISTIAILASNSPAKSSTLPQEFGQLGTPTTQASNHILYLEKAPTVNSQNIILAGHSSHRSHSSHSSHRSHASHYSGYSGSSYTPSYSEPSTSGYGSSGRSVPSSTYSPSSTEYTGTVRSATPVTKNNNPISKSEDIQHTQSNLLFDNEKRSKSSVDGNVSQKSAPSKKKSEASNNNIIIFSDGTFTDCEKITQNNDNVICTHGNGKFKTKYARATIKSIQ